MSRPAQPRAQTKRSRIADRARAVVAFPVVAASTVVAVVGGLVYGAVAPRR